MKSRILSSTQQPSVNASQGTPPQSIPPSQPGPGLRQRHKIIGVLLVVFIAVVPGLFFILPRISRKSLPPKPKSTPGISTPHPPAILKLPQGLGTVLWNGEYIGINDSSFPPFLRGPDGQSKIQAAAQLKLGRRSSANSLWYAALKITNNDAEALIYLENQNIPSTDLPYVTLIAGVDLSDPSDLSVLQGVYVGQHEFNTGNHGFQLRILIANSGSDIDNVPAVAQQIVRIANQDKTIVGVVSWLTSAENVNALPILSNAHIPLISPAASSDHLTSPTSPYFFRVVPPNHVEGKADALFAEHTLHAKKVVVFVDNSDPYSQNLAQDFEMQFTKDGNTLLKEEPFTTDSTSKIGSLIQDALKTKPDLLYFTSRDTPDSVNFQDALPISGPYAHLPALAGDAGYVIHKSGYGRWYFTAFAFADEWSIVMGNSQPQPSFFQDYSNDFNQGEQKPAGYYGYTRPDDIAILSYDVTSVFEDALQIAITAGTVTVTSNSLKGLTPEVVDFTLSQITGPHAWQGVSGQISFDNHHNPDNKAIVILSASADGHTHMNGWEGCFAPGKCQNDS